MGNDINAHTTNRMRSLFRFSPLLFFLKKRKAFYCRTKFTGPGWRVTHARAREFDFSSLPFTPLLRPVTERPVPNCSFEENAYIGSCLDFFRDKFRLIDLESTFVFDNSSSPTPPSSPLEPNHPLRYFYSCFREYYGFDEEKMCALNNNSNPNSLVIHIRNGDIFRHHAHPKYGQQSMPSMLGAILFKQWDEVNIISEVPPGNLDRNRGPVLEFLFSIRHLLPYPIKFGTGALGPDFNRWMCGRNVVLSMTTWNTQLTVKRSGANIFLPADVDCPVNLYPLKYYKASNSLNWMSNWTSGLEHQLKLLLTPFKGYSACPYPNFVPPPEQPQVKAPPFDDPPGYRSKLSPPLFHLSESQEDEIEACTGLTPRDLVIDLRDPTPFQFCSLFAVLWDKQWRSVYFLVPEHQHLPPLSEWLEKLECFSCKNYSSLSFYQLILEMVNAIREFLPVKDTFVIWKPANQETVLSCAYHIASPNGFQKLSSFEKVNTRARFYRLLGVDKDEESLVERHEGRIEQKIITDTLNLKDPLKFLTTPCHSKFGIEIETPPEKNSRRTK